MKRGFSLISLLITLVIIGVLMVWLLPQYTKTVKTQHNTQLNALRQAQQLQQQLNAQQKARENMFNNLEKNTSAPAKRKMPPKRRK